MSEWQDEGYIRQTFLGTLDDGMRKSATTDKAVVVNFSVSCKRTTRAGKVITETAKCAAFGDRAELAIAIKPGTRVHGSGRIQTNTWTDSDGRKHSATDLVIDDIWPL